MEEGSPAVRGRPRAAAPSDVAAVGLRMFARQGYDATTMGDIAAAAGISRPTLFRYFPAKSDIVWDRYDDEASELRAALAAAPPEAEPLDVLCDVLPRLLAYGDAELDLLRTQVLLIAGVPDVQGHAQRRSSEWVQIITEYVADSWGVPHAALLPAVVGRCLWSAGWTALTHWAAGEEPRPDAALRSAFDALRQGFSRAAGGAADLTEDVRARPRPTGR